MAKTIDYKSIDPDTKVKIISNTHSKIYWIQLNSRPINLLRIGTPASLSYLELENMAYTSDLIQTGDVYVADKNVFEALQLQNVKYEDIKLSSELKKMLSLSSEELKEEMQKLPEGNKELLAELALANYSDLKGSVIDVIEEETNIKVTLVKEDEKANKENQKKNTK